MKKEKIIEVSYTEISSMVHTLYVDDPNDWEEQWYSDCEENAVRFDRLETDSSDAKPISTQSYFTMTYNEFIDLCKEKGIVIETISQQGTLKMTVVSGAETLEAAAEKVIGLPVKEICSCGFPGTEFCIWVDDKKPFKPEIPEKFESDKEFTSFFKSNEMDFEVALEFCNNDDKWMGIYKHIPSERYFYVEDYGEDGMINAVEVELAAYMRYDENHDVKVRPMLDVIFTNDCCGEYIGNGFIEYRWFVRKEK